MLFSMSLIPHHSCTRTTPGAPGLPARKPRILAPPSAAWLSSQEAGVNNKELAEDPLTIVTTIKKPNNTHPIIFVFGVFLCSGYLSGLLC